MNYLESIDELIKVSLFIEHQSAETYPWKLHLPMEAQIHRKRHPGYQKAPTGALKATTRAICTSPTNGTKNELNKFS